MRTSLIGPFRPDLAGTLPFKALIAIFWDLQPLWSSSLMKSDLDVFGACSLRNKVGDPQFVYISDMYVYVIGHSPLGLFRTNANKQ